MKKAGKVLSLYISEKGNSVPVHKTELQLDPKGILGDKHYDSTVERTILISTVESYHMVEEELGISMPAGYLGENILLDFNPYHLQSGQYLHIGSSILEITQYCTLCKHLGSLDKRIPKLLKNDRGIFAKVVREGTIKVGDTVSF